MEESRRRRLTAGGLTARLVVGEALGMLRQDLLRIAMTSLIFFALPAIIATIADLALNSLSPDPAALETLAIYTTFAVALALRVLGPVAFAGFLDEAVARQYLEGERRTLREVIRILPWRRLIVADVIVVILVAIGLELFIVPGLVAFGAFGLIGPVIVREGAGLGDSFRRTLSLAARTPALIVALVVAPFALELIVHEILYYTLHSAGPAVELLAEWIVEITLGATVGLMEVALAMLLMERHPLGSSEPSVDA